MRLSTLLSIHAALGALDGYDDVVKVADTQRIVRRPYVYASPKTSWLIAKMKRALKDHVEDYNEARDALIRSLSGGIEIATDDREMVSRFTVKVDELRAQEVEVTMGRLKLSELLNVREERGPDGTVHVVSNPIPASVLEVLIDVIEE